MISPQGYSYGEDPKSDNPFWTDEEVKESITATATVSDTTGTPEVTVTKDGYNFNFAFTNLKGEKGDTGPAGSDADISKAVTGISVTNENGVYGISETKGDGSTSDVGSIEVPDTDNLIAEVNDSIVENNSAGYDFHTIKETENNGTQNDVGKFYLAQKQITALDADGSFTMVDQSGVESKGQIDLPESGITGMSPNNISNIDSVSTSQWKYYATAPVLYNNKLYFPHLSGAYSTSRSETAQITLTSTQTVIKLTFARNLSVKDAVGISGNTISASSVYNSYFERATTNDSITISLSDISTIDKVVLVFGYNGAPGDTSYSIGGSTVSDYLNRALFTVEYTLSKSDADSNGNTVVTVSYADQAWLPSNIDHIVDYYPGSDDVAIPGISAISAS